MIPAIIERCAGIDVGEKFLAVCVMTGPAHEEAKAEVRKFGTVGNELESLRKWLQSEGCTHVVMESTGVYWKPVLNILEDDPQYNLKVILANPQQVKAITGHKTDPHDARWLAHLLRHGMIRPSFIPPRAIRELRDFTRRRKQMIGIAADERNRVQKVLEDANVKIGDVLSDVFGLSGQLMLEALVNGLGGDGRPSAFDIAQLARGHAKKKLNELTAALEGHQMRDTHRTLIRHAMRHMAFLTEEIEALDQNIAALIQEANLTPAYELLQTIPGIRSQAAATILAESGPDMKQFPKAANFSSWSGLAPGNNESAGKKKRAYRYEGQPAHQDRSGRGGLVGDSDQAIRVSGPVPKAPTQNRPQAGHRRFRPHSRFEDLRGVRKRAALSAPRRHSHSALRQQADPSPHSQTQLSTSLAP